MADIIQLLPDAIANQIAAGEVVQRPASVVKELVENAIDAGSTSIKLIIKDAGKQAIQVIDNGVGMSPSDARTSFERHATSKINKTEDLFSIRTLGFRGEALASIAAVAQVELKTRQHDSEVGTHLTVEGSKVLSQTICETTAGTNILVKNIFFNIPARRKFLKSNTVEFRHILDEFQRIALANPQIHFEVFHNGSETYHLPPGSLRKRIVNMIGKNINDRLVPIEEETEWCKISGFIGKPEAAKKSRGEQYFLINGRFIKSPYLHHAVMMAYENLIPPKSYPFYVLKISMDPSRIDVNVHPTKQEIKFEDERLTYNVIKAAVRHALSQYNVAPSLDFDQDPMMTHKTGTAPLRAPGEHIIIPSSFSRERPPDDWEKLYEGLEKGAGSGAVQTGAPTLVIPDEEDRKEPVQMHQRYIFTQIKSGVLLLDQQFAHQRVLFEQFVRHLEDHPAATQKLMFPQNIHLSTSDAKALESLLPYVRKLGFEIEGFGKDTFILHGIPAHLSNIEGEERLFQELLEQFGSDVDLEWSEDRKLAASLARSASIKRGQTLSVVEMQTLIDQLFACEVPYLSPFGKKCFITFELDQLESMFNQ